VFKYLFVHLDVSNFKNLPIDYIQLFQLGEEQGFNHYFNTWYKQFCFFAINYTKDQVAAEDIVSDCFIKVWNKREKFTNEAMLKSYFYTSIANACTNLYRDQKKLKQHKSSLRIYIQTTELSHLHNIISAETINLLMDAINKLPPRCKEVFVKHYIEEKSQEEIAKEMNTSISTVSNQKARGIKLLKSKLTPGW